MEYIKKEELIIGEIYKSNKYNHIFKYQSINGNTNINIGCNYRHFSKDGATIGHGLDNIINATSEEKHWLNECIKLDKFITFEEAVKTFIPEYVECLMVNTASMHSKYQGITPILNKIYEVSEKSFPEKGVHELVVVTKCGVTMYDKYTKPSTKEAYDAQFVVKEPEFVLPEKWYVILNSENRETLNKWRKTDSELYNDCDYECIKYDKYGTSLNYIYNFLRDCQEITFEQFKKYVLKEEIVVEKVIEPLPQFKVIETIETITKVENNEGNQFFIGDKVITPLNNIIRIISSFTYNQDKTELYANFKETLDVINVNKIEHYIEPKVEETLLEKAKRLYPIGTKFKSAVSKRIFTIKNHIQEPCQNPNIIVFSTNEINASNEFYACVHSHMCEWAEIIE